MQRRHLPTALAVISASALAWSLPAPAAPVSVGQPAPPFSLKDTAGRLVQLADFAGKTVVLEWTNPGCPFVRKHYASGNLPAQQKAATAAGVIWLTVNSTSPRHGDHMAPAALGDWMTAQGAAPTATLLDPDGLVGRSYGAKTTPQLVVIQPQGRLAYVGAVDSIASARPEDIARATQHVPGVLAQLAAGQPVRPAVTVPYGCSVKYD